MKTSGLTFIFHITSSLLPHVLKHLGKQVLQVSLMNKTIGVCTPEIVVGDIKGSGILMGRRVGGIDIDSSQSAYRLRSAEKACHFYYMAVSTTIF